MAIHRYTEIPATICVTVNGAVCGVSPTETVAPNIVAIQAQKSVVAPLAVSGVL